MTLFRHHFKKTDSWMWMYWAKHNGYGLTPRLHVNYVDEAKLYFYFNFSWWKLCWYWVKGRV